MLLEQYSLPSIETLFNISLSNPSNSKYGKDDLTPPQCRYAGAHRQQLLEATKGSAVSSVCQT